MANTKLSLLISDELKEYFDQESKDLGIPRNSVIVMALKQYVEQKKAMKDMSGLKMLVDKLDELKKAVNSDVLAK